MLHYPDRSVLNYILPCGPHRCEGYEVQRDRLIYRQKAYSGWLYPEIWNLVLERGQVADLTANTSLEPLTQLSYSGLKLWKGLTSGKHPQSFGEISVSSTPAKLVPLTLTRPSFFQIPFQFLPLSSKRIC